MNKMKEKQQSLLYRQGLLILQILGADFSVSVLTLFEKIKGKL